MSEHADQDLNHYLPCVCDPDDGQDKSTLHPIRPFCFAFCPVLCPQIGAFHHNSQFIILAFGMQRS